MVRTGGTKQDSNAGLIRGPGTDRRGQTVCLKARVGGRDGFGNSGVQEPVSKGGLDAHPRLREADSLPGLRCDITYLDRPVQNQGMWAAFLLSCKIALCCEALWSPLRITHGLIDSVCLLPSSSGPIAMQMCETTILALLSNLLRRRCATKEPSARPSSPALPASPLLAGEPDPSVRRVPYSTDQEKKCAGMCGTQLPQCPEAEAGGDGRLVNCQGRWAKPPSLRLGTARGALHSLQSSIHTSRGACFAETDQRASRYTKGMCAARDPVSNWTHSVSGQT